MIIFSVFGELVDIRENLNKLKKMAYYECPIRVKRVNEEGETIFNDVMSGELVPGDIFVVPEKCALPCDAILISGEAVVNEAILTGESAASNKTDIPDDESLLTEFSTMNLKQIKHFLFSGTTIIKSFPTHYKETFALVVSTGYSSIKGSLLKSILFPTPERFYFQYEIKIYILVLIIFSFLCMGITLPTLIKYFGLENIITSILDAITFSVPPELPIAMSIGTIISLQKLKEHNINCVNISKINISGRVSVMVFDKTGTLTENCISISKLKILESDSESPKFLFHSRQDLLKSPLSPEVWKNRETYLKTKDNIILKYFECLACCHSLVNFDDRTLGDPLEVEMFKATDWNLCEKYNPELDKNISIIGPKDSDFKLSQVHQFSFLSELQLMSVITKTEYEDSHYLFTKGSPERIYEICRNDKIPQNYFKVLQKYTKAGKRVIALAYKELVDFEYSSHKQLNRDKFEYGLNFLGFIISYSTLSSPSVNLEESLSLKFLLRKKLCKKNNLVITMN